MKKTKMEKGITLIALIITIVVLLILAVVTIGAIRESSIITHAQNAKNTYNEEQIKEEIELFNTEYLMNNKKNMQDATKERMVEICKETGVKPEQLIVYYDLCNANENKANENTEGYEKLKEEYVFYRIDKTTEEEQAILETNGVRILKGDMDLDGVITQNDYDLLVECALNDDAPHSELELKIGDLAEDGYLDVLDVSIIERFLSGHISIDKFY